MNKLSLANRRPTVLFALTLLMMAAYLIHRSYGLNPAIFADEWYYSKYSRLTPIADSILPSYLYLWVMRGTSACGTGFLDCARVINVILFVAAAPFLYGLARVFTTRTIAVWVALLSTMLPLGSYTAYFMPESGYYFGFSVLSWYVLTRMETRPTVYAAVAGTILGLMSIVKVHALFLLPALCLFMFAPRASARLTMPSVLQGILASIVVVVFVMAAKFGVSYLIVGKAGLSLFGSFYGATAATKPHLSALLAQAWISGRGHMMALSLIYALPLSMALLGLVRAAATRQANSPGFTLQLYTFLMLGSAMGVSVLFTATLGTAEPSEVSRLHFRYYDFTFPLLLVIAAQCVSSEHTERAPNVQRFLAAAFGLVLILAAFMLPSYRLVFVDTPEAFLLADVRWSLFAAVLIGLILLAIWTRQAKRAAALFLFAFIPATILLSESRLGKAMQYYTGESSFDTAGKFARKQLPLAERKELTVMGSNVGQLMRTLFLVDADGADFIEVPLNSPISKQQLPANRKWVLIVDNHPLAADVPVDVRTEAFVLVSPGRDVSQGSHKVTLNGSANVGPIASYEGLSGQEPQGRWSDKPQVLVHTAHPLSKGLTLTLTAAAFGPNVNVPITMRIGNAEQSFKLGPNVSAVQLKFDNAGGEELITIDIPKPTSPQSLGQSGDSRLLGIMIQSITFKNEP